MNKMQTSKWVRYTVLGMAALCLGTGLASAQAVEGKFTLPFEARWGQATLSAGDYTFTFHSGTYSPANLITVYSGTRGVAMIMAPVSSRKGPVKHSEIVAVRVRGGTYRIRLLQIGPSGETVSFPIPKSEQLIIARGPGSVHIPLYAMAR